MSDLWCGKAEVQSKDCKRIDMRSMESRTADVRSIELWLGVGVNHLVHVRRF